MTPKLFAISPNCSLFPQNYVSAVSVGLRPPAFGPEEVGKEAQTWTQGERALARHTQTLSTTPSLRPRSFCLGP